LYPFPRAFPADLLIAAYRPVLRAVYQIPTSAANVYLTLPESTSPAGPRYTAAVGHIAQGGCRRADRRVGAD
jgi:hypothetical protein